MSHAVEKPREYRMGNSMFVKMLNDMFEQGARARAYL